MCVCERELHSLDYSANACNSQIRTGPKPRARNSLWVFHKGGRGAQDLIHCLLPPRMSMGRKLECEAEPGLEPRSSNTGLGCSSSPLAVLPSAGSSTVSLSQAPDALTLGEVDAGNCGQNSPLSLMPADPWFKTHRSKKKQLLGLPQHEAGTLTAFCVFELTPGDLPCHLHQPPWKEEAFRPVLQIPTSMSLAPAHDVLGCQRLKQSTPATRHGRQESGPWLLVSDQSSPAPRALLAWSPQVPPWTCPSLSRPI